MKKRSKRSQITLFIVLGIVLLVMMGFFVYIVNYTTKKQTQRSVKTTQKQELRVKAIENYITTCLEKTAKKGLLLLGEQGGVIFKEQGGLSDETELTGDLVKDVDTKIMLGIKEPIMITCNAGDGCFYCIPQDIDCRGTCNKDGFCVIGCNSVDPDCGGGVSCGAGDGCYAGCYNDTDCGGATCMSRDGCIIACTPKDPDCLDYTCPSTAERDGMCILGCASADPDCDKNEDGFNTNAPLYPWRCFPKMIDCSAPPEPIYNGYFGRDSLPALEGTNSIITQLKAFITKNITNCIDLSVFKEQGFDISTGAITIENIILTEKDTIVNLKYPLNVKHFKTGEKATLNKFSYSCAVNLKGIYDYAKEIIKRDISNVTYNPNGQTDSTFEVAIDYSNHALNKYNDIIKITDNASIIDGQPYTFNFARKNRRPALEFINDFSIEIGKILTQSNFNPKAQDPDEDIVNFNFTCGPGCGLGPAIWPLGSTETFTVNASDGILEDYQEVDVTTVLPP